MNNIQKRFILFLGGCIVVRLLYVYVASKINTQYLPVLGILALFQAIGFAYLFVANGRKTGPEVFGDKIWWTDLRPIHAAFWFAFAIAAISKNPYSWVFLLLDVIFGLISFLTYHLVLRQA